MRKVILRMNEQEKYQAVKNFVDHGGNKNNLCVKLGLSKRQINRLIGKLKREGKQGFIHGNRFKTPSNKIPEDFSTKIILLAKHKYKGENEKTLCCNFKHFKDLIKRDEGIVVPYSTLYNLLMKNNIRSPKIQRQTKKDLLKKEIKANETGINSEEIDKMVNYQLALEDAHPRKEKAKYFGELVQMDACSQDWTSKLFAHLHLAIDNSLGVVLGGYFDKQETLFGYYNVFKQILLNYGIPCKFLTDKRTVFTYESRKKDSNSENESDPLTQFAYACKILGVELEATSVPQAKGQIERLNETFQDRLRTELILNNINDIDEANKYLTEVFIPQYNEEFSLKSKNIKSAFETVNKDMIDYYLSRISTRVVDKGCCISYKSQYYGFFNENDDQVMIKSKTICTVVLTFNNQLFANIDGEIYKLKIISRNAKYSERFDEVIPKDPKIKKHYIPPMNHPWRNFNFSKFKKEYKNNKYNLR